jgi:hypothetical protein
LTVTAKKRNSNSSELLGKAEAKAAQGICSPMTPRLLPLKGAADHIGLSVWALREAVWAGLIPVVRFPGGRKLWLDVNDLDAFIEDNKARIS